MGQNKSFMAYGCMHPNIIPDLYATLLGNGLYDKSSVELDRILAGSLFLHIDKSLERRLYGSGQGLVYAYYIYRV